jgi:UDP-N-acetylglucosamine acyltransferase
VLLAGHVRVGNAANLGLGASVHQGRYVGAGVMLGMSSVVTRDIPPFAKAYGSPARVVGANVVGMRRGGIAGHS